MPKDNESTMKWKIDIRELTTAMQTAKRNISQANAEFKNATAGMTRWQNSITGVEAKIKQLNSVSANQKEVLKQLNEEYKIIVKEFGEASPEAQKLATQILNQETAIKKTESQLSNYNDSLEELKQAEIDASSESSKLARTIESQEQELDSLKKAYKEAVLAKGADSKEAKTLANEITTLNGTLNENRAKMEEADKATDELTESLETADKEASEAGNGGFTVLKGALAGLVAEGISIAVEGLKDMAVALVDVGKAAIGNYADYEQLVGGVETLFKDASGTVQNYADEAYKTAGLSANEYMETVTGFSASLIQGLGGDTQQAAELANRAITDMADNSNKMGTDMNSLMSAYQGFAKQNYTMLDNLKLGYGGTQQEMVRLINDSGILNEKIESLDGISFDQIIQAIGKIQDNLGITGTTAEEAEKTIQGSSKAMEAAWNNLLTGMADGNQDFSKLVDNFVDSVLKFGENMIPRIKTTIEGMGTLVDELAKNLLPDIIAELTAEMPGFLAAISSLFSSIGQSLLTALPEISSAVLSMTSTLLTELVKSLPEVVSVIFEIGKQVLSTLSELLPQILTAVADVLPKIVVEIANQLPSFITALGDVLVKVADILPVVLDSLISALPGILNALGQAIMGSLDSLVKVVTALIKSLAAALPEIFNMIVDVLPELFTAIREATVDSLPELMSSITELLITLIEALPDVLSLVSTDAMSQILDAILKVIVETAPLMNETALILFKGILEALPQIFEAIMLILPDLLKMFMIGLQLLSPQLKAYGVTILKKVTVYFLNMINLARQKAAEFVLGIINNIISLPGKVAEVLLGVIAKVIEWAVQFVQKATDAARDFVSNAISGLAELPGKIGAKLSEVISKASEWVQSMGGKAKEGASSFVSNVQAGLSGIADKVKSVGTHLVEGIWEGMSSSMDWIKGKINGWVDDVLDYLKKVFKIGSPSKLMADEVGHWLPLGMASGFDASMPEAEKEMQTSINNAVRGLKADVSVSSGNINAVAGASGVNLGGTNQEVNFYQTINSPKAVDRLSIYRDTNELLFTSKVRLSNV